LTDALPDVPETLLSKQEVQHLRVLHRWYKTHGDGWWVDTVHKAEEPAPQVLLDLQRKGFVKLTNRLVSGPLRIPTGVWGAHITPEGRTIATMLKI